MRLFWKRRQCQKDIWKGNPTSGSNERQWCQRHKVHSQRWPNRQQRPMREYWPGIYPQKSCSWIGQIDASILGRMNAIWREEAWKFGNINWWSFGLHFEGLYSGIKYRIKMISNKKLTLDRMWPICHHEWPPHLMLQCCVPQPSFSRRCCYLIKQISLFDGNDVCPVWKLMYLYIIKFLSKSFANEKC